MSPRIKRRDLLPFVFSSLRWLDLQIQKYILENLLFIVIKNGECLEHHPGWHLWLLPLVFGTGSRTEEVPNPWPPAEWPPIMVSGQPLTLPQVCAAHL